MNPVIGTCQLCLAPNKELKRSHFVPSFAYKVMRQSNVKNPKPGPHNRSRCRSDFVASYSVCILQGM